MVVPTLGVGEGALEEREIRAVENALRKLTFETRGARMPTRNTGTAMVLPLTSGSLSRLRMRRDGLVTYRVKKLGRRRATHRIMTPVEFLARIAALIPPPRYPISRLHGVFGPRHKWRARVVPKPPERVLPCTRAPREREGNEPKREKRPEGDRR